MTREELVKRGRTRMPSSGVETVTVPGAVAGWDALLKKYGTITLSRAVQPAIGYAENGFVVTPVIAADWADETRRLQSDPGATATFMPGGHTPKAGDWFRNPDMANSLRVIGKDGPAAIYGGELGQKIVARMASEQKGASQVLERLGFRAEALLADYVIDREERTHDLIVMSYDVTGLNE
jgi:gamma-glutamyltranspeptidase/glutathione hydrolase